MRLTELSNDKIKDIFLDNQDMRNEFSEYMLSMAIDNCLDKLSGMRNLDYCLNGYRQPDYVSLKEETERAVWNFLEDLTEYEKSYGLSIKMSRMFKRVYNLAGTNLFKHYGLQLVEMFYQEEIKSEIDFAHNTWDIEDRYEDYADSIDLFLENMDYEINEEGLVYQTSIRYLN